jgi:hypothetical protein
MEVLFVNLAEICKISICHISTDSGPSWSEIVLADRNWTISAYCNEFPQNWWISAISPNIGGFKYFHTNIVVFWN